MSESRHIKYTVPTLTQYDRRKSDHITSCPGSPITGQDVRQQAKDAASCYFADLWGLKSKLFIKADKMRAGGKM
jgi:hypothetical protein